jgi:hypothetical protein
MMPAGGIKSGTSPSPTAYGERVTDFIDQYESVRRELGKTAAERDALRRKMEHLEKKLDETIEQFRELEKVLTDPEQSTNAIVYYRLRAVWSICHQQLTTLAEQTTARLTEPDRKRYESKIEADKQIKRQAIETRKSQVSSERDMICATVRHLEEELAAHRRVYQTLIRRKIERSLMAAREKLIPYDARLRELEKDIARLEEEIAPPYPGLPTSVRREINLLLIALAQQNYLLFRMDNVADCALAATRKPLKEFFWGTPSECQELDRAVREALLAFKSRSVDTGAVRCRAEHLRRKVRYSDEHATVPISETVNFIAENIVGGATHSSNVSTNFDQPIPVNVLSLNYWNIQEVLLLPQQTQARS